MKIPTEAIAQSSPVQSAQNAIERSGNRIREWCAGKPKGCLVLALFLLGLSIGCLMVAVERISLAWVFVWVALGGLLGALGLLLVNELLVSKIQADDNSAKWSRNGFTVAAGGLGGAAFGLSQSSGPVVASFLVVAMVGVLILNIVGVKGATDHPEWYLWGGLAVVATTAVLFTITTGTTRLIMVVLALVGLAAFKLGLPAAIGRLAHPDERNDAARRAVTIGLVCVVVGAAMLAAGLVRDFELRRHVGVFGVFTLITGLSATGLGALGLAATRERWRVVWQVGLLAIAAGWLLASGVSGEWGLMILVICGALAATGAWFIFRGEGLVLLVFIGFLMVWVLADRTGELAVAEDPDAERSVLALGDSFMSGEGATDYLAGTNTEGAEGNTCRRAPTAYIYTVAQRLSLGGDAWGVHSLACSGAKMAEITDDPQKDPLAEGAEWVAGSEPQLEAVRDHLPASGERVKLVLLSIGGNDTGFSTVIQGCLLPSDCSADRAVWLEKARSLGPDLVDVYDDVKKSVPKATVVVMPYPVFIDAGSTCDLALGSGEIDFAQEFITALNETIEEAARRAGVRVFPDSATVFENNVLCDSEPAANFVHLSPPNGSLGQRFHPGTWVHGTMHPRKLGHSLLADGLIGEDGTSGWLPTLLAAVESGDEPLNPEPASEAWPQPDVDLLTRADDLLSDKQWINDQLNTTARKVVVPIMLLVVGGLLFALGGVKLEWFLFEFLSPEMPDGDSGSTDSSGREG